SRGSNIIKLGQAFVTVVEKPCQLGLDVDIDKLELIHLTRRRSAPGSHVNVALPNAPSRTIHLVNVMRWLSVFFDRKLSWKKWPRGRGRPSQVCAFSATPCAASAWRSPA
ncbi:uncharacterized protein SCHCODRAFT_02492839, partial [Schizophyllum commune H4-8]|uniref:uncharacterized protein n=1 Tax=Schizophyllum commune (strain H4-8 / FGSC 9210) TaxID=578458 RepID=UPI00215FED51